MVGTALWHEQGPQMILLWSIVGKFFLQIYMFDSNIRHAADFSPLVFDRIRWSPNSGTSRVSRRQLARILEPIKSQLEEAKLRLEAEEEAKRQEEELKKEQTEELTPFLSRNQN